MSALNVFRNLLLVGAFVTACVSTLPEQPQEPQDCEATKTCDPPPNTPPPDAGSTCAKSDCELPILTLDVANLEGELTGAFEVTGIAEDNSGDVLVSLYIDDVKKTEAHANTTTFKKFTFRVENAAVLDGQHKLEVRATDAADNTVKTTRTVTTRQLVLASCPTGQYRMEHFLNTKLTGAPQTANCVVATALDYEWDVGGPLAGLDGGVTRNPDGGVAGEDFFSVRWVGMQSFPTSGTYKLSVSSDDGVRLWVDGSLLIDKWKIQPITLYEATAVLTAGDHSIILEFFEDSGSATLRFSWQAL
ncbi:MAG: PA14 domain-containing protein [Myxococcaceae bacterium]